MKKIVVLFGGLLLTLVGFAQQTNPTKEKEQFVRFNVFFESAKHELTEKENTRILGFLDTLQVNLVKSVILRGFTDSDADSLYNIKLSDRRVATVQEFFEEAGVPEKLISRSYFGENMAGNDSISENLKSKNRRVEIVVTFKPVPKPAPAPKDTCKLGDTIVVLKNGTIIKGTVCDLNDTSDLEITEALTIEEMMAQGLQTMGNNENQLISGGMITIRSKSGKCNFNKPLVMYVPVLDSCSDAKRMSLFTSDDGQGGRIWSAAPGVKIKIVQRNGADYYEVVATKCMRLNLDFLVKPPISKTSILIESEVSDYTLRKLEMYSDCPRFFWSFKKKISSNSLNVKVVEMKKPPKIRFFLVNNENKKDTLVTPFMSLSDLKHGKFNGFSGQYEDRTTRWIFFKKREMVFYPRYRLQDKHLKSE